MGGLLRACKTRPKLRPPRDSANTKGGTPPHTIIVVFSSLRNNAESKMLWLSFRFPGHKRAYIGIETEVRKTSPHMLPVTRRSLCWRLCHKVHGNIAEDDRPPDGQTGMFAGLFAIRATLDRLSTFPAPLLHHSRLQGSNFCLQTNHQAFLQLFDCSGGLVTVTDYQGHTS